MKINTYRIMCSANEFVPPTTTRRSLQARTGQSGAVVVAVVRVGVVVVAE